MKLSNPIFCESIFSKMRGQMFRSYAKNMVFVFEKEQKVPLHMMFVFFSIDVLFLDSSCRVVELIEGLKPFRFYSPKNKAKYVVEVPSGVINSNGIKVGTEINF